ncbi:EthD domain-containing protein [Nocardia mikamii]|uniref:EthD domain-containing protein n=1 Tax=Nocardia mikamii TaxID=508464 RepID=UPI000B0B7A54|nr:EthD domain-containing protein [Nocardia mikamii]
MNENTFRAASSRRAFIGGAAAAGLAAVLASHLPMAAADTPTGGQVKLVCVLRRRLDMTPDQFNDYWLNVHAPIAIKALTTLGATRYIQSHTIDTALNTTIAASHNTGPAYDGITEVWFPSEQELIAAIATPAGIQANQTLADNEKEFVDLPRSSYFMTKEYVMIG